MYSNDNLASLMKMDALAPEIMKTFWAFDRAAVAEGAIPVKHTEVIALGVARTPQCPYWIDIHSGNARQAGATNAELVEAALVASSPAPASSAGSRKNVRQNSARPANCACRKSAA